MRHGELVSLAMRWLNRWCTVAFAEFQTGGLEAPDAIGWRDGFSMLVECKTSRADFLADKRKPARSGVLGMGRQRYYLCEAEIITIPELPAGWGLLWVKEKGRIYFQRKSGDFYNETDILSETRFLVSMLRRAQVRLGKESLSEWLHFNNMNNQRQGGMAYGKQGRVYKGQPTPGS